MLHLSQRGDSLTLSSLYLSTARYFSIVFVGGQFTSFRKVPVSRRWNSKFDRASPAANLGALAAFHLASIKRRLICSECAIPTVRSTNSTHVPKFAYENHVCLLFPSTLRRLWYRSNHDRVNLYVIRGFRASYHLPQIISRFFSLMTIRLMVVAVPNKLLPHRVMISCTPHRIILTSQCHTLPVSYTHLTLPTIYSV